MTDWNAVRAEFPALANWTYLNSATFGQMPRRGVEALQKHFARRDELACSDFMKWFDDMDDVRASVARLIHATPADIAFVPNAATGLSLLLGGIDWKPGARIVTLENEFPHHYYYPSLLAKRGVEFVETSWDGFYDALTPRTRLVAFGMLSYSTGFRAPLAELAPRLRDRGILLCVDGTQGLGALEFDAAAIRPDMFICHGYKWLLAPNGAGFIYVDSELRRRLTPNVIGWRSHKDWRGTDSLFNGMPEFRTEAEQYEGGMLSFALLYAMQASVELMLEIGPAAIEKRVLQLAGATRDILRRAGGRLIFDQRPHYESPIVTAQFEGRDSSALARELHSRRVLAAARCGNLRVSPHFYNDETDLARLESALKELL